MGLKYPQTKLNVFLARIVKIKFIFIFSEYAQKFVEVIKHAEDDEDVKKVLGFHAVMLHKRCNFIKLTFAREAHQTGSFCCCFYLEFAYLDHPF